MPALVNISVGSLRGTSGDDGTMAWPLSAKNFRNVDLISLTPLILVQSQKAGDQPAKEACVPRPLLDQGAGRGQQGCNRTRALRRRPGPVGRCCGCGYSPRAGRVFFSLHEI